MSGLRERFEKKNPLFENIKHDAKTDSYVVSKSSKMFEDSEEYEIAQRAANDWSMMWQGWKDCQQDNYEYFVNHIGRKL